MSTFTVYQFSAKQHLQPSMYTSADLLSIIHILWLQTLHLKSLAAENWLIKTAADHCYDTGLQHLITNILLTVRHPDKLR